MRLANKREISGAYVYEGDEGDVQLLLESAKFGISSGVGSVRNPSERVCGRQTGHASVGRGLGGLVPGGLGVSCCDSNGGGNISSRCTSSNGLVVVESCGGNGNSTVGGDGIHGGNTSGDQKG